MKQYSHILFDLDGTLSDPGDGIIRSVSYALSMMGLPVTDAALLRKFIGPPLQESFRDYFPDDDSIRRAILHYRDHYRRQGMRINYPYPGIVELLADLHRRGRKLSVATSKLDSIAAGVLDLLGMRNYFDTVGGSDAEGTIRNKTDVIERLVAGIEGVPKNEIVMVGDMDLDIIGARNNDIHSIGVTWGYGKRDEITGEKPTHIADSVDHLRNILLPA
jgi:phosphoglycolate phosphatase